MFKRFLSLLLCLMLVLSVFTGCGNSKKDSDDEVDELKERIEELEDMLKEQNDSDKTEELEEKITDSGESEIETLAATVAETLAQTTAPIPEITDVPATNENPWLEYDFGGAEFRILTAGQSGGACNDFGFEEENSDYTYLEKAQYKRILAVEQGFNVDIVQDIKEGYSSASSGVPGPGYKLINTHVASGTDMYDLCLLAGYDVSQLATQGYLYNMNMIPGIDLTNSYWDQNAVKDLSINGVTFFTTGEITVSDNNAAYCIMFNKKLAQDYRIEDPYELVNSGEWTIEKFAKLAKQVYTDINQDGAMDGNDRYGLLVWDDSITGIINAAGQRCCTVNENGEIELTLFNETTLRALDAYVDIAYDEQHALQYQRLNALGSAYDFWVNNQGLFMPTMIGELFAYREIDTDFGILPYPKSSIAQENYYTTIYPFNSQFICVPLVVENINMVGAVTEALAYYGEKNITPAYYEVSLIGQTTRDEDSAYMLDIIFENLVYDIGYYYQVGTYNKELIKYLRARNSSWSVMNETYASQAQSQLDTINDAYAAAVEMWQ